MSLGGATSLTSKVAIISLSDKEDTDLDYFFVQVVIGNGKISTTQTCGNILAGVVPFAVECGMIKAKNPTTSARVNIHNEVVIKVYSNWCFVRYFYSYCMCVERFRDGWNCNCLQHA